MTYNVHTLKMKSNSFITNTYIVKDISTNHAAIIDPAWELEILIKTITDLNIENFIILLTHSHYDHTNLIEQLCKLYSPEIYIHTKESSFYNFNCSNLKTFNHLDTITIGETTITTLLTPGHTFGSSCFLLENELFTGDTLFIEGCGICNCQGGSLLDMYKSLQYLKRNITDNTRVYPGHSYFKEPGTSFYELYDYNIYLNIDEFELFVKAKKREFSINSPAFI